MTEHLEKPNPEEWAHSDKPADVKPIFKRSGGRCLCNYIRERKTCLNYRTSSPDGDCRYLDGVLGVDCMWREGAHD